MALPKFLQPYLASYDLSELDIKKDRELIITELLNKGDSRALSWLGKTCSQKEIKEVISNPIKGMWMESILSYWLRILNVKLPEKTFKQALINLHP